MKEFSCRLGALTGEFGGTVRGGTEDEARSKEGPRWKPSELSERANHSSWVAEGEEGTGRSQGPCPDCDREECEEEDPGELGDGASGRLGFQVESRLGLPLCLGILTALREKACAGGGAQVKEEELEVKQVAG